MNLAFRGAARRDAIRNASWRLARQKERSPSARPIACAGVGPDNRHETTPVKASKRFATCMEKPVESLQGRMRCEQRGMHRAWPRRAKQAAVRAIGSDAGPARWPSTTHTTFCAPPVWLLCTNSPGKITKRLFSYRVNTTGCRTVPCFAEPPVSFGYRVNTTGCQTERVMRKRFLSFGYRVNTTGCQTVADGTAGRMPNPTFEPDEKRGYSCFSDPGRAEARPMRISAGVDSRPNGGMPG